jgi:BASS family bile acid:Na+ symporter
VKTFVDIAIPAVTFLLLMGVGMDLTRKDFLRLRLQPLTVATGLLVPLVVLPPIAVGLTLAFRPPPDVEAGLMLIAVCPIGGISNTYSYLARASTALSVTLTAISSLLAVLTIPALDRVFELALGRPFGFSAPAALLVTQLVLMLALPIGLGMWIRRRWPRFADEQRPFVQRVGFGALAALIALVMWSESERFATGLSRSVPLAAAFVLASLAAGWTIGGLIRAAAADRFTLAVEFATRNVAIASAIAVTLLGRVELAVFATIYFLTEVPLMLAAVALFRRRRPRTDQILSTSC